MRVCASGSGDAFVPWHRSWHQVEYYRNNAKYDQVVLSFFVIALVCAAAPHVMPCLAFASLAANCVWVPRHPAPRLKFSPTDPTHV
jgi:hypothetical protein